jgi:hypothetical protein
MQDSGAPDGRGDQPLTVAQATALYRDYVNDPVSVYSLEELQVPGAWDAMGIQLFSIGFVDEFGYVVNLRPFVAFDGKLYPVTKYPSGGLLSAVLTGRHGVLHHASWFWHQLLGAGQDLGLRRGAADPARCRLRIFRPVPARIRWADRGGVGRPRQQIQFLDQSGVFGWLRDDGAIVVAVDAAGTVIPYRSVGGW